jgi:transposase
VVYIDESGFAHDMPRKHGYAPVGKRCVGKQNWHARGRLKVVGALLVSCLLTVSLFSGSINANTFSAWVAQDLLPQLPPHSVVVMDNAAFHKRADIQQLLKQAGHLLEYLPAYSPQLNPIERKWAQAKAIRKQKKCSVEELFKYYIS